ncbi:MAG: DUF1599 domain-containing protein [Cytophagales bacterium]|nr:DUF1599 domain-containing protein [Cytophagales bacterium]MDW8384643.1 DUF1599 domain-containing protein [Flammeovirgaceae bacterium]
MSNTVAQYNQVVEKCLQIFEKKTIDYGTSWRVLRLPSLTDQLYIKAKRIRQIQETGKQQIADDTQTEFIGIINYAVIALMQIDLIRQNENRLELSLEETLQLYKKHIEATRDLMLRKNHDYAEAWRDMRISSITDIILMKILRIKQIEENQGKTLASEGVEANYRDIINYAVFALILST